MRRFRRNVGYFLHLFLHIDVLLLPLFIGAVLTGAEKLMEMPPTRGDFNVQILFLLLLYVASAISFGWEHAEEYFQDTVLREQEPHSTTSPVDLSLLLVRETRMDRLRRLARATHLRILR